MSCAALSCGCSGPNLAYNSGTARFYIREGCLLCYKERSWALCHVLCQGLDVWGSGVVHKLDCMGLVAHLGCR